MNAPVIVRSRGTFRNEVEAGPHRFVLDEPLSCVSASEPLPAMTPPLPAVLAATVKAIPREPTTSAPLRVELVFRPVPTEAVVVTSLVACAIATPMPTKPTPTPVASDCACE